MLVFGRNNVSYEAFRRHFRSQVFESPSGIRGGWRRSSEAGALTMEASLRICGRALVFLLLSNIGYGAARYKLLLVSFDGMRWDYIYRRPDLKSFQYLELNGVKADYLTPPFPTQTSPSHITIATGLYPESHGVVLNAYYNRSDSTDPIDDYYSTLSIPEWWDNGYEPIWSTVSSQGLKSGVHLYPGGNMTVAGKKASLVYNGNSEVDEPTFRKRIDTVMEWLRNDSFDFVALYFEQPDEDGHARGPYSKSIADRSMPMINRTIAYLIRSIEDNNLSEELDVIIASDHGMSKLDEIGIPIAPHVNASDIHFKFLYGAMALIEPGPDKKEKVYSDLKNSGLPIQVFYKEELPERFHFSNNDRITSIIVIAHPQKALSWNSTKVGYKGNHAGFDNMLPDMRSIFYMIGPSFKKNFKLTGFESVHIYELMCKLLDLNPAPNNGSLDVLLGALKENSCVSGALNYNVITLSLLLTIFCFSW